MAKGRSAGSNKTYLQIVNGKFAERVKEGTAGAVARYSEKADKIFHEVYWHFVEGKIASMKIEDSDFGEQLVIEITDTGAELEVVKIPVDSRFFSTLAVRLPNIKRGDHVFRFVPYSFKGEDGKTISGMNIFLDGAEKENKVEPFFTRENQGKMPPFPEGGSKKDVQRWRIDLNEFLTNVVNHWITQNASGFASLTAQAVPVPETTDDGMHDEEVDDDLPF